MASKNCCHIASPFHKLGYSIYIFLKFLPIDLISIPSFYLVMFVVLLELADLFIWWVLLYWRWERTELELPLRELSKCWRDHQRTSLPVVSEAWKHSSLLVKEPLPWLHGSGLITYSSPSPCKITRQYITYSSPSSLKIR